MFPTLLPRILSSHDGEAVPCRVSQACFTLMRQALRPRARHQALRHRLRHKARCVTERILSLVTHYPLSCTGIQRKALAV